MSIGQEEIRRLADLTRLALTPAKAIELGAHLNTMLAYVEKLNELNTDGIEPMAYAVEVPAPMREDRVTNQADTEALLQNAPAREGDFFKAPKIIE
ncbi:MAG TPA: Asp-tRNA(Asn)/Glu-tRNA(Gln) amidotransferase subunit GatC [Chthonomonadales bacterium]|nr:Asp-tRNA(Asn)/Glu-tRNA(Gln) amidotransferase subunit GatC [Chthonomonadales bacterium]